MATYVKQIMTEDGPKQIDYQALANLPTIDTTVKSGSTNAVQGGAVYAELQKKLDAEDGKAADSILFGGQAPEYYATKAEIDDISEALGLNTEGDKAISETINKMKEDVQGLLGTKLDKDAQAADSAMLGGKTPDHYASKTEVDNAQLTADNAWTEAQKAMMHLCGCWIEFTDEDGNPTDEPYVHWNIDEETGAIVTGLAYSDAEESEY